MLGICPECHTAYSWEVPRYGCACGRMTENPPVESVRPDYTALGRSPFAPNAWWGGQDRDRDRDRDDRPRPAQPRASGGIPPTGRPTDVRFDDWEREREREQRRRERDDDRWDRGRGGGGRGRGRSGGGGRRGRGRS